MKKTVFFLFAWMFFANICISNPESIDSLKNIVKSYKSEEKPLNALLKLARIYTENGGYDTAMIYYNDALLECNKLNKTEEKAQIFKDLGVIYEIKGMYDKAMEYQLKALKVAEESKDLKMQAAIMVNIGIINFNLKKGEEAISNYRKSIELSSLVNDTLRQILALNNMGNTYMTLFTNFDSALLCFEQTIKLGEAIGYRDAVKVGLTNISQIYINSGQLKKAIDVATQVYEMNKQNPYALYNLGSIYYLNKDNKMAVSKMKEALEYCQAEAELKQILLKDISAIYKESGQFEEALGFFESFTQLKDSIHSLEVLKNVDELNTRFETEKKEKQILVLSLEKKKRNQFIFILASIIALFIIMTILVAHRIRSKRLISKKENELKEQRIKELEKDKQLIAVNSVLQGEETERHRLARELHDGLGGLLSGVKLSLTNIKGNVVLDEESVDKFGKALNLLDNSIVELRRVAHNMMPEALVKFGVDDALSDFCTRLNTNGTVSVTYQNFGDTDRMEQNLEIAIYRIVQELINNAMKHANASEIIVQKIQDKNRVHLTVQDNGKGFNVELINEAAGAGLKNIKNRVESLKGILEINSSPKSGTEVSIEFNL